MMQNEFVYLMSIAHQIRHTDLTHEDLLEIQSALEFKFNSIGKKSLYQLSQAIVINLKSEVAILQKIADQERLRYDKVLTIAANKTSALRMRVDGLLARMREILDKAPKNKHKHIVSILMLEHLHDEMEKENTELKKENMTLKMKLAQHECKSKWQKRIYKYE